MHEFSAATRRLLDAVTITFGIIAGVSLEQWATMLTMGAALMSMVCGGLRVFEFVRGHRGAR